MNRFPLPEAVIFDLDGTLFQTETLLETVHRRVFETLRSERLYLEATPPVDKLLGSLGMLLTDIWKRVMPDAAPAAQERANVLLLQYELEELALGRGSLYPGVRETLESLRGRGIRLFIASNGLEAYVKGVPQVKGIAEMFEGTYSAGEFGTRSKVDLVRRLLDTFSVKTAWMVGDRSSDVEAGKRNGLSVIGCDYAGFGRQGELDGADVLIRTFPELLSLLPK
jgi:phosphoglycolate phosphatase